jgi:hypothetical protein
METIVQQLLQHHPDLASWVMSDDFWNRGAMSRGDLRKAFPTLRRHRSGEEVVKQILKNPTALRREVSLASGFASGANAARLAGLRSLLPSIARGALGKGSIAGIAATLLGGQAMDVLSEDAAAKDRVREMEFNRAMNRSLDRELRSADRRAEEERQRMADARQQMERIRQAPPIPRPMEPNMNDGPWLNVRHAPRDTPRIRNDGPPLLDRSVTTPEPARASAPARAPSLKERMRAEINRRMTTPNSLTEMGRMPIEDIVMAEIRRQPETRKQWVPSSIPGVMGSWQDLPYELQPAPTLSEREILRMIAESR